jgi:Domain of unknown function (DUF6457)
VTLDEWITAVSEELGVGPVDAKAVLDLTRDVAHGVARPAAPLTCLLIGLAADSADDLDAILDRVRGLLPAT